VEKNMPGTGVAIRGGGRTNRRSTRPLEIDEQAICWAQEETMLAGEEMSYLMK